MTNTPPPPAETPPPQTDNPSVETLQDTERFQGLDNMGARLRALRGFLSLSRKEMEKLFLVKEITLKTWEMNQVKMVHPKTIKKFVTQLQKNGLRITREWLIYGEGLSPFDTINLPNARYDNAHELLQREQHQFQCFDRDRITYMMPDDSMQPYFRKGDVLGAKRLLEEELPEALGSLCLFLTSAEGKVVGRLVNGITTSKFAVLKGLTYEDPKSLQPLTGSAYEIIWWRKGIGEAPSSFFKKNLPDS